MNCDALPNEHMRKICRGDIEVGTPEQHDALMLRWFRDLAKATGVPRVYVPRSKKKREHVPRGPGVGTLLQQKIHWLTGLKSAGGCNCQSVVKKMDLYGEQWCVDNREWILDQIVSNAAKYDVSVFGVPLPAGIINTRAGLSLVRVAAGRMLDSAIRQVVERTAKKQSDRAGRQPTEMRLSRLQVKLRNAAQLAPPPEPDPFTDTPVIHFAAHLWPLSGECWQWHIKHWNEVAASVNGRCVVGVARDSTTVPVSHVKALLSDRFEILELDNAADGEVPTFRQLQESTPSEHNDVLLYCHGKGVRPHTCGSESVRLWTEMMYESVIHNRTRVIQKLGEGYKTFGAFRTFGNKPLRPTHQWHYSGTFFAVRAKHLRGKPVKSGYGGVEVWPGDHFAAAEAWCEFFDSPGYKFGYDIKAMYPKVVDAQMQWEVNRIGGPRCEQHKRELDWFTEIATAKQARTCLVIGSRNGGLEHQLMQHGITCTSIDIAPQPDNTWPDVIIGDSSDPAVRDAARAKGPFDIVFIDGDHGYTGVKADWEYARSLAPKLIAFHDIADTIKHRREGCEVDRLWSEIKRSHDTVENIVGCGWGGIGVVNL
jgi:hypothetical protein